MALPKLVTPEFETKLPSTKETIIFRPFLVKEEKILYMALESEDEKEIENAITNVLSACISSDVEIKKLASYDIEYLFLQLRSKSVGEVVELNLRHGEDKNCDHISSVNVNLNDVKVHFYDNHNYKIQVNEELGIKLKDPDLSHLANITGAVDDNYDNTIKVIAGCVDLVYDKENVYDDFTLDEAQEFLLSMTQEQFKNIQEFFETIPKVKHTIKWRCKECGINDKVEVEGLQSFFS